MKDLTNKEKKRLSDILNNNVNIQNEKKTILLIDGTNVFLRAMAAWATTDDNGNHIGGVNGFLYTIGTVTRKFTPERIIVVFDGKGGSKKRKDIYPDYKKGRKGNISYNRHIKDVNEKENLKNETVKLLKYLKMLPVNIISYDYIEADDVISYIATNRLESWNKIIVSMDKDFLQLVDNNIKVWNPSKKILYDEEKVKEEYEFTPNNFLYFRLIDGDDSDNIKGVKGIGVKRANKFLKDIFSNYIEDINHYIEWAVNNKDDNKYAAKLVENKNRIITNYKLMNLKDGGLMSSNKMVKIDNILKNQKPPTLKKFKFVTNYSKDNLLSRVNIMTWINSFKGCDEYRSEIGE